MAFGTGVGGIGVGGNGEGVGGVPVQTVSRLSILLVAFILDTPGSLNDGIVESPVIIATVPVGEIYIALAFWAFVVEDVQTPLQK